MIRSILRSGRRRFAGRAGGDPDAPSAAGIPLPWLDPPPGPWPVERAYRYCEDFARAHHENFPVASRFVPSALRPHLVALYAFARAADDFADEPQYDGHRSQALDAWQEELHRCFHGEPRHPVFVALHDTIDKRGLTLPPFEDLLSAFRADLEVTRYATFTSLRAYTARSAEPVGRLLLGLFGYRDPELVRFADEISTAVQLTNYWQDVASDAARDHIYIPGEDLHFFGVSEADLKSLRLATPVRDLMRFEVARTRALFERGRPLLGKLGHDLKFELALIWLSGMAILDKIEEADFDVFTRRPIIGKRDKAKILARAAKRWAARLDVSALRRLWP
ncbi:MAG: squalene synthase HpnC [Polyangia bacterium]